MSELSSHRAETALLVASHVARLAEFESNTSSLKSQVAQSEIKIQECARLEVECQLLQKKVAVHEEQSAKLTEQLSAAIREKSQHRDETEEVKTQITAMEELTVSLTQ